MESVHDLDDPIRFFNISSQTDFSIDYHGAGVLGLDKNVVNFCMEYICCSRV